MTRCMFIAGFAELLGKGRERWLRVDVAVLNKRDKKIKNFEKNKTATRRRDGKKVRVQRSGPMSVKLHNHITRKRWPDMAGGPHWFL